MVSRVTIFGAFPLSIMDNINDNDNDHITLSDESDVNASSPEIPSGL